MLLRLLCILSLWVTAICCAYAQSTSSQTAATPPDLLPQRAASSPTAAALERYALMPVNEAAGTPTISIPLYAIHCGNLSVPVSLSYHAAGVRVADIASWVGLGWSLNAGGVITRIVRGLPDEQPFGFRELHRKVPLSARLNPQVNTQAGVPNADYYLLDRIAKHEVDYQPDLYTFNFGGRAGCFMQDTAGQFRAFPFQPLHIAVTDSAITLTDEQGTRYWFNDREYSRAQAKLSEQHISAWYLSQIISADRADTIRFTYALASRNSNIYSLNQQISIVSSISSVYDGHDGGLSRPPQDDYKNAVPAITHIWTKRLQRITFRGGAIGTETEKNRLDGVGDEALRALHIVSPDGRDTLKRVVLYQSYFNQTQVPSTNPLQANYLRLRLDSVSTATRGAALREPPYRFTYNSIPLPNRVTGTRDHWGYANGSGEPFWLIPSTTVQSVTAHGSLVVGGADRTPNPAYVQAGILTQIRYPTGGRQQFIYEPNTVPETYRLPVPRLAQTLSIASNRNAATDTTTTLRFQITAPVTRVKCQVGASRVNNLSFPKNTAHFSLRNVTLNSIVGSWSTSGSSLTLAVKDSSFTLPVGTYELEASARGEAGGFINVSYQLQGPVTNGKRNQLVGGVRLQQERLQAMPDAPVTSRHYYYQLPGTNWSSGELVNETSPLYVRKQLSRMPGQGNSNCTNSGATLCATTSIIDVTYTVISSTSLSELEGQDQVVSYQTVTVVDSASTGQTAGRTVSTYSTATESALTDKPFPPKLLASWKRGNLLTQRKYATAANGQYRLLTQLVNRYTTLDSVTFVGFVAVADASFSGNTLITADADARPFAYTNTRQTSGWQHITQSQYYTYAPTDSTSYHVATTRYQYGSTIHCQPVYVDTELGTGQWQRTYTRYVADYKLVNAMSTTALALQELLYQHVVAQPVEQVTMRLSAADTVVTRGTLYLPRLLAPGVVVPSRQLGLVLNAPLSWHRFQPAHLQAGQLAFTAAYEVQLVYDAYDAQRHLVQAHIPGGRSISYLWDSWANSPLVKASAATVQQLAVTSFELGGNGRWTYDLSRGSGQHLVSGISRSGHWAYRLDSSGSISCDSLPSGTYLLSLWYQGALPPLVVDASNNALGTLQLLSSAPGNWHQAQIRLSLSGPGSVRVQIPGMSASLLIDDLTLFPVGAQLTTYTHDALRGVTSQTGPDGRTQTYEYDGLGRLVRTRDEQGRILGQQQYHYANH